MNLEYSVQELQISVKEQDETIILLKRALESGHGLAATMKIKMKEPKAYDSTQNAKLLGNFRWDVEKYFD